MAATLPRQPFGQVNASRLQGLSAQKNCQNAVTEKLLNGSSDTSKPTSASGPIKRPHAAIFEDEHFDSENVDPALASSKRSMGSDGTPSKKTQPLFNLNTLVPSSKNLSSSSCSLVTPTSPLTTKFGSTPTSFSQLPAGPSSAPAGRSPKHKRVGILSKKRTPLSPFKRIEPPSFGLSKKATPSGLPFSIDAALSGTIPGYSTPARSKAVTIEESMPKGWFFDIHEDTPDQEATNMMEHSACTLDISSDDEAAPSKKTDERGKENIPPIDHDTVLANTSEAAPVNKHRRSADKDAMVDVGEERSPLGALPAEDFYAQGLDAKSVAVIPAEVEEANADAKADEADDEHETDENAAPPQEAASDLPAPIESRENAESHPEIVIAIDEAEIKV